MKDTLSAQSLCVLLDQMHEAFVIVDSNCTIHFCSKGFLNLNMSLDSSLSVDNCLTLFNSGSVDDVLTTFKTRLFMHQQVLVDACILWHRTELFLIGSPFSRADATETLYLLKIESSASIQSKDNRVHEMDKAVEDQSEALAVLEDAVRMRTMELEQANAELRRANRDLTSFTNISNHDLQEPLRKIQNFVLCIQGDRQSQWSDSTRFHFKRIHAAAKRMQRLLEDVLRYSKIRDKNRLFKKCDLTTLVREVLKDFRKEIDDKHAILEVQSLGAIEVVPDQFKELVRQLLTNSLKFHKPEQRPRFSIKSRYILSDSELLDSLNSKQQYLNLIFEDRGIGFDEEYKEKIFEVFQRLHAAETYDGTGIGLPICRRIVEHHQGFIKASGKRDEGMRIDVYLPVRQLNTIPALAS